MTTPNGAIKGAIRLLSKLWPFSLSGLPWLRKSCTSKQALRDVFGEDLSPTDVHMDGLSVPIH